MKALVVTDFKKTPQWSDFAEPVAGENEVIVHVTAAALSNLVKARANGTHYSSRSKFPFVPGVDGTGRLEDGTRVYFYCNHAPYGSMAEKTVVSKDLLVRLPDDLDATKAAALANPAMSSWAALTQRAKIKKGESVLINGATGTSGRLAIQIAKQLGAKRIIATGRDAKTLERLQALGATEVVSLTQSADDLTTVFRKSLVANDVSIVLDYLWGASALALINAIGGPGSEHSDRALRFVQIGSISGGEIAMPASALRSTALEIMGSGLGSVNNENLIQCIKGALEVAVPCKFEIEMDPAPMHEGASAWAKDSGKERLVFTLP